MGACMKPKEKNVQPIQDIQETLNIVEIEEETNNNLLIKQMLLLIQNRGMKQLRARIEYLQARIKELEEILRQLNIIIAKLKQLIQEILYEWERRQKEEELKIIVELKIGFKKEKFEYIINNRPGTAPQQIVNNEVQQQENIVTDHKNANSQIIRSQNIKGSQSSIFQSQTYRKKQSRQYTQFEVTNQHQNHQDDGVDIGFKIERSQIYQQFPEITSENSEISIKLFYLFAKEYFKTISNLYLCYRRGAKGKLQFARNLFYVTTLDMFETMLIKEPQNALIMQDFTIHNILIFLINLLTARFIISLKDTIQIILNMMKTHKQSINQPSIILLDDEKVDEIKKQYRKMKLELSKF
ncbi:hypothetical protein pb186bvf_011191 [Paramecium bursaria]